MNKLEQKKLYEKKSGDKIDEKNKSKIGLSLLNIAIESNNEFDYKFYKISENLSFYSFNVKI